MTEPTDLPPAVPDLPPVVAADAPTARQLRHRVLRPHQAPETIVFSHDDDPRTLHAVAWRADGLLLGCASVLPDPEAGPGWYRLRGMATAPEARGVGLGRALLDACLAHARAQGAPAVWCTARTSAAGFYLRAGFVAEGPEFDFEGIGPHLRMTCTLG